MQAISNGAGAPREFARIRRDQRDHRVARRAREVRGSKLALGAEADDDRRRGSRQLQRIVAIDAGVDEDPLLADGSRIRTLAERRAQRAAEQAIDDALGAGETQRRVVPEHQRLAHEQQIAVADAHLHRRAHRRRPVQTVKGACASNLEFAPPTK